MTDYQISENFFDTPIGAIIAWAKSLTGVPSLPSNFVECNGQVLSNSASPLNGQTIPNLNGASAGTKRFLRGSSTSGTTGGTESHSHGAGTFVTGFGDNADNCEASALTPVAVNTNDHIHQVTGDSESVSTLPSYYEVVWIMRIR